MLLVLACFVPALVRAQVQEVDSVFVKESRPIIFVVNKTYISPRDKAWIVDSLMPALEKLGERGVIIGRAAASPEGPTQNNRRLAVGRRQAADRVLSSLGLDISRIRYDVVTEDYGMLLTMMRMNNDADYPLVKSLTERYGMNTEQLKRQLQVINGGSLWRRLLATYFPQLRAVRIMLVDSDSVSTHSAHEMGDVSPLPFPDGHVDILPPLPPLQQPIVAPLPIDVAETTPVEDLEPQHRIPLLNVRTNLLYDGFWMPHFGMAPMWNIGVEYYPRRGHFTYSLWFMEPYYHRWHKQKFFQIRDYEFETRFYFRGTKRADYRGFYVGAALDANIYGIGLGKRKGWEGEGLGAQATLGFVQPLCRHHQWKLQVAAGFGFYMTQYDPYLYGVPDYFGHKEDGLYYYNTTFYRHEFKKRQHHYQWFGPTQLAISLSYDLLWRRGTDQSKKDGGAKSKKYSFKRWEISPKELKKKAAK